MWLLPVIAALTAGWLAYKAIAERGPTITITFKSAEGIEPRKTQLKYKNVQVGTVEAVSFAHNLQEVVVTAQISKDFAGHLVEDTRFWVERPRITLRSVSGLETLLSGPYIALDAGASFKSRREFSGLEAPPLVSDGSAGTIVVLRTANAGSFDVGSPVLYRHVTAGTVTRSELEPDGAGIRVTLFVNAPFDRYITPNTRFWNASGVEVKVDPSGIKLDTESLASILVGGIAFETPPSAAPAVHAAPSREFELFGSREAALKNPEAVKERFMMLFNESVRGLRAGAPVDLRGMTVGEVTAVKMKAARSGRAILAAVEINLYPDRIEWQGASPLARDTPAGRRRLIDSLVGSGLRAQLRPASLLSGDVYVAIDFFPGSPAKVNWAASPPEFPTQKASIVELREAFASIAAKLERMPLDELSGELRETLQAATRVLNTTDASIAPELRNTAAEVRKTLAAVDRALASDSPLQTDTRQAMRDVARAAQAIRVLADYLERHPEALVMGKKQEAVQ